MAAIRFPLKMADGTQVKTIEELREHFDLVEVIRYYNDGRLYKWLKAWYYDAEAEEVGRLDSCSEDLKKKICEILGVTYQENRFDSVDLEDISKKNERIERLKRFTADDRILSSVDSVAFTQEELMGLLGKCERTIYLCGNRFVIPGDIGYVTYVGVNNCTVEFAGNAVEAGINLQGVDFDISDYIDNSVDDFIDYIKDDYLVDNNHNMKFYSFFQNNSTLGVKLLRQEAEKGSARTEIILGLCYLFGFGVKESIEEAAMWLKKAAEQNYVRAQYMLGIIYFEGKFHDGYEVIEEEAKKWLKKAAEQGYAQAQYKLGEVYYYGR